MTNIPARHSYENILRKYVHNTTFSNVIMANCQFILIKRRDTFRNAMIILECPHSLTSLLKAA